MVAPTHDLRASVDLGTGRPMVAPTHDLRASVDLGTGRLMVAPTHDLRVSVGLGTGRPMIAPTHGLRVSVGLGTGRPMVAPTHDLRVSVDLGTGRPMVAPTYSGCNIFSAFSLAGADRRATCRISFQAVFPARYPAAASAALQALAPSLTVADAYSCYSIVKLRKRISKRIWPYIRKRIAVCALSPVVTRHTLRRRGAARTVYARPCRSGRPGGMSCDIQPGCGEDPARNGLPFAVSI